MTGVYGSNFGNFWSIQPAGAVPGPEVIILNATDSKLQADSVDSKLSGISTDSKYEVG